MTILNGPEVPKGISRGIADAMSAQMGTTSREMYWEEMDAHQRLEVVRAQLVQAYLIIGDMGKMIDQLLRHQHSASGDMLKPFVERNGFSDGRFSHMPYRLLTEMERKK